MNIETNTFHVYGIQGTERERNKKKCFGKMCVENSQSNVVTMWNNRKIYFQLKKE